MEPAFEWVDGLDAAITVCDEQGTIFAMNRVAEQRLEKDGGRQLLGRSIYDCHPRAAQAKLARMYADQKPNQYTISKNGEKRIIHQLPWFRAGQFAGIVELSIAIPQELPHFDRK